MSNQTIKSLRKAVADEAGPEAGSVVTFTRVVADTRDLQADLTVHAKELSYAAIFVNGQWYFTGTTSRSPMTQRRFAEFLASPMVKNVQVVTATEPLDKAEAKKAKKAKKVYAIDSDGDRWEPVPGTDLWTCVAYPGLDDRDTDALKASMGDVKFFGLD
jgi:hypothetical protein